MNIPTVTPISLNQLESICDEMVLHIKEKGFQPDALVSVERAGRLIARHLQRRLEVPVMSVYVSRTGTGFKKEISAMLRLLPGGITRWLRVLEAYSGWHKRSSNRNVQCFCPLPTNGSSLLIVDDAVDTGNTMQAVVDFFLARGYNRDQMKIAVITTTSENASVIPDVSLRTDFCAFPWSSDSPERKLFEEEYRKTDES